MLRRPRSVGWVEATARAAPSSVAASASLPRFHSIWARQNTAGSASASTWRERAQSITSRQARSASSSRPRATSASPRPALTRAIMRGLAAAPRGLLGLHQQAQLLAELAVGAGVAGVDVVGDGQLGRGISSPVAGELLEQPVQPQPALAGQAALAPPLVELDRQAQAVADPAGRDAPVQAGPDLGGELVQRVRRQRHRSAVGVGVHLLQRVQRPGQVPVAGRRLLAGRDQRPHRERLDRVEHPVASRRPWSGPGSTDDQRLVDEHGQLVDGGRPGEPLHGGQVERRRRTRRAGAAASAASGGRFRYDQSTVARSVRVPVPADRDERELAGLGRCRRRACPAGPRAGRRAGWPRTGAAGRRPAPAPAAARPAAAPPAAGGPAPRGRRRGRPGPPRPGRAAARPRPGCAPPALSSAHRRDPPDQLAAARPAAPGWWPAPVRPARPRRRRATSGLTAVRWASQVSSTSSSCRGPTKSTIVSRIGRPGSGRTPSASATATADQVRVGDRGQVHEPDAVGEGRHRLAGDLQGQPGLAGAAGSDDVHQPVADEQRAQFDAVRPRGR